MNSSEIFNVIEAIAATSSKNEKLAMLAEHKNCDSFKAVLTAAYNPFMTYGIAKAPLKTVGGGLRGFNNETWLMLGEMVKRTLTGNAARDELQAELNMMDEGSAELLRRIIMKDLRAGFSESSINKAIKGLIPEFPYQRCSLPKHVDLTTWPWDEGVISQEKADGMFANIDHESGGLVRVTSRQGSVLPIAQFAAIEEEVRARLPESMQYHGEIVVMVDGVLVARQIGNGIINRILSGGEFAENEKPVYQVWDCIPLDRVVPKGKFEGKYILRIGGLIRRLKAVPGTSIMLIPTRVVHSQAEAYAHAAELMRAGKEGSVIKHPDAIWRDGDSKEQVKIKLEFEVDLEVVAVVPGKFGGKNDGRPGSLTCKTSDGELLVDVTVKNEAMRDDVEANPETWLGSIIKVLANDIMEPSESSLFYSLFLPRMVEPTPRRDKFIADDLERVIAQKQAAIFGEKILKEAA